MSQSDGYDNFHYVPEKYACPRCGERAMERLAWIDEVRVECASCWLIYAPCGEILFDGVFSVN